MIHAAQFKYDPERIQVFVIEPMGPSMQRMVTRLEEAVPNWQVVLCSTLEAVTLSRQMEACVVIGYVDSHDAMLKHVNMLRLLAPMIAHAKARVLITHTQEIAEKAPVERLGPAGCWELVREPVQDRSLIQKIDRAAKTMPAGRQIGNESDESLADRIARQKKTGARPAPRIIEVAALTLQSDCWLNLKGGAKKVGERWTVRLTGPAPAAGRWVEVQVPGRQGVRSWQWVPSDISSGFIREQGAWIYTGIRAPEYQDDLWWFVGDAPSLEFLYENQSYGAKFRVDETDALLVARDSEYAKGHLKAILMSRSQVVRSEPEIVVADGVDLEAMMAEEASHLASVHAEKRVSALAAAFLTSELLRKRELSAGEMAHRYCEFISQSIGGARVELWVRAQPTRPWVCAGTHDRGPGQLGPNVQQGGGAEPESSFKNDEILLSGIMELPEGRQGRLAFQGQGMGGLPDTYADELVPAAQGILRSF